MSTDQRPDFARRPGGFRHEALMYRGTGQFVERTAAFVRDALATGEPIMVAVIEPRASLLRDELGADARRVHFIDMAAVGRNPARIIPAWQEWVTAHEGTGRGFRGIGEPIWSGRSPAELVECHQHEALLNTAFDDGPPWWLVCPYDVSSLEPEVVARAQHTHPGLTDGDGAFRSTRYPSPEFTEPAMLSAALSEAPQPLYRIDFGIDDLPRIRSAVTVCAAEQHVEPRRVDDIVLVANELACNGIKHGGGTGTLRLWRADGDLVCEVHDRGLITDPMVGRRKPNPHSGGGGGAGLWIANVLCDLVQIRSRPESGTTVRVRVHIETQAGAAMPDHASSNADSAPDSKVSKG